MEKYLQLRKFYELAKEKNVEVKVILQNGFPMKGFFLKMDNETIIIRDCWCQRVEIVFIDFISTIELPISFDDATLTGEEYNK